LITACQTVSPKQSFFEKSLTSARTPDNLFAYADFLQDNNQFKASEQTYQEALSAYRKLAADNPAVYLPNVATTLNNLGILVRHDSSRRKEADSLFSEAQIIRQKLH
jgi:type II secretory pathway pseudopilin PulG